MATALLVTQCLQNDFVAPIGRFDPLPNRLHVGYREALRLMGEVPSEGPVARLMRWALAQPDEALRVVHLRDGHDAADPAQHAHLERFGDHCLRGTAGAAFAFPHPVGGVGRSEGPEDGVPAKDVVIVDSPTLNDFQETRLAAVLAPYAEGPRRVGIVGAWTEAKVTFLAYELTTRYPGFDIAVCSALTASSSRQRHFEALDQLERILGVRVLDSVGELVHFLGGVAEDAPLPGLADEHPTIEEERLALSETDRTLTRWLFRDCRSVRLRALGGGFSGNVVAASESVDLHGHQQVPHVVKIGERTDIGQERVAFERVQDVLGNNAPQIADFVDFGGRGGLKYRYASMGGGGTTTFQKMYGRGAPLAEVRRVLDTVFGEQLARFYRAATLENGDLLAHYGFQPRWADGVRRRVERLLGQPAPDAEIEVLPGVPVPNVCRFYEETLAHLPPRPGDGFWQSVVHGDLNGANIVLDGAGNVWLIDFFHTRRAHVLMDLVKLENDLLYIFTPLANEEDLRAALTLSDALVGVEDLAAPLAEAPPSDRPALARAWATARALRAFHPALVRSDRDPLQLHVAQLRYAVHTLAFDESSPLQRRWALYTAARCVERITGALARSARLRLDWLESARTAPGRLALTLLPGRRDQGRDLTADLDTMGGAGVGAVLCLVPRDELDHYGVPDLFAAYRARGIAVHHLPIVDQRVPAAADLAAALAWTEAHLAAGATVVAHCVGGLGRTGLVGAALLRTRGATADAALAEVRRARGPRAVETPLQEAFVRDWAPA